ncbi:MAG TPA: glycosyltransferase family 61 protein, partial [Roseomonas sp.]
DLFHLTYRPDANYTHFILEILPKIHYWLMFPEPRPRLLLSRAVAERLLPLLGLYGIGAEDIVIVPSLWETPLCARRIYLSSAPMLTHDAALRAVRSAVGDRREARRRIYIHRRGEKSWFRKLLNESKALEILAARGFESLALEDFTLPEQVALFREAECIAGVYGGGLFNTIFCEPGTRLLSLTSPDYHRSILDALPEPLKLRGATVVGESFSTKLDRNNSPFVLDLSAMTAACDLLEL